MSTLETGGGRSLCICREHFVLAHPLRSAPYNCSNCPFISSPIKYEKYQGQSIFFYFLNSKPQKRFQKMQTGIFSVSHLCSKASLGQQASINPVTAAFCNDRELAFREDKVALPVQGPSNKILSRRRQLTWENTAKRFRQMQGNSINNQIMPMFLVISFFLGSDLFWSGGLEAFFLNFEWIVDCSVGFISRKGMSLLWKHLRIYFYGFLWLICYRTKKHQWPFVLLYCISIIWGLLQNIQRADLLVSYFHSLKAVVPYRSNCINFSLIFSIQVFILQWKMFM